MKDRILLSLVRRAKSGDEEALNELLDRFRPLIRACCRGLSLADGQDLEQELKIQLIDMVRRYKPSPLQPFDEFVADAAQGDK